MTLLRESPFVDEVRDRSAGIVVGEPPFPDTRDPIVSDVAATRRLETLVSAIDVLAVERKLPDWQRTAQLSGMVVDVTDPAKIAVAGRSPLDTYYVGSLVKIAPLYVAFELRERVRRAAQDAIKAGFDVTRPGWQIPLITAIERAWGPKVRRGFERFPRGRLPRLDTILEFRTGGAVGFRSGGLTPEEVMQVASHETPRTSAARKVKAKLTERVRFAEWLTLMVRYSDNGYAGRVIDALGYSYINGTLRGAGFFDPTANRGLWVSANYRGTSWTGGDHLALSPPGARHYKPTTNFAANASEVARMLTLIVQGKLFGPGGAPVCGEIGAVMKRDPPIDLVWRPIVSALGSAPDVHRIDSVTGLGSKLGIGTSPRAGVRSGVHDCAIVERDHVNPRSGNVVKLRYVVVGLGGYKGEGALVRLLSTFDSCVAQTH